MPTIPNVPFSTVPIATGYDPTTEPYPLNRATTVLDLVDPDGNDRQHATAFKREESLRGAINAALATLNALLSGGPGSTSWVLYRDGALPMVGNLDAGSNKVVNLATPTAGGDAANKTYADTQDLLQLPRDGTRPMTGNIDLANNKAVNSNAPTAGGDLTNKTYVDTQDLLQLPRDGTRPMTGDFDGGGHKLTNLADPSANQHAVTVAYMVNALLALLPRDGTRAMTGNLDAGSHRIVAVSNPTTDADAANKGYVDAQDNLQLPRDGSRAMTGSLDMATHKILNVFYPTNLTDAASKQYVDDVGNAQMPRDGSRAATNAMNMGGFRVGSLAPGVSGTDAVNLNQLTAASSGRLLSTSSFVMLHSALFSNDGSDKTAIATVNLPATAGIVKGSAGLRFDTGVASLDATADIGFNVTLTWSGTNLTAASLNVSGVLEVGDTTSPAGDGGTPAQAVVSASNTPVTICSANHSGTTYALIVWLSMVGPSGPDPYRLTMAFGLTTTADTSHTSFKTRGFLTQDAFSK